MRVLLLSLCLVACGCLAEIPPLPADANRDVARDVALETTVDTRHDHAADAPWDAMQDRDPVVADDGPPADVEDDLAPHPCLDNPGLWSCTGVPCNATCPAGTPRFAIACDGPCTCTNLTSGAKKTCKATGKPCPSCNQAIKEGCCDGL